MGAGHPGQDHSRQIKMEMFQMISFWIMETSESESLDQSGRCSGSDVSLKVEHVQHGICIVIVVDLMI